MATRRGYVLLPILILLLSGCFRQASQPEEETLGDPISNTAAPTTDLSTGEDTSSPSPTPIITVVRSTPVPLPTEEAVATEPDTAQTTDDDEGDTTTNPVPLFTPETATATFVTPALPGGQSVSTPTPTSPPATGLATPTDIFEGSESAEMTDECIYVVQTGDTLFRIAVRHEVTVDELRAANPEISGDLIRPGDELNIPGCEGGTETEPSTSSVDVETTTGTEEVVHVVQPGETLGAIARQYNVTILSIVQANELANPDRLSVGQELTIPSPSN